MSGTSRDGIDVALVEIGGTFPSNLIRLIHAETAPFPRWLRAELIGDGAPAGPARLTALDFAVGECFGRAAMRAMARAGLAPADVDVIGSHGQTVFHAPGGVRLGPRAVAGTLQIGRGSMIARLTGVETVTDFRSADIAVGGEGAPLVPIYDYVTLRSPAKSRIALNIGGIANLTALPRGGSPTDMVCFDTGPGNCLLDIAAALITGGRARYDRNGALARRGEVDRSLLARILGHPYFRRRPPKSTGWEEFGETLVHRIWRERARWRPLEARGLLATLTEATAESIAMAVADFVRPHMSPDQVIATGGGARNTFLMERLGLRLADRFPAITVEKGEAFGIDSDAKEACAFAYLAYLHLARIAANVVSQAAGLRPAVLGCLYPAPARLSC
jgi:anhydro-N-acetylmuramic acid kinase